jgi:hypothetical protein
VKPAQAGPCDCRVARRRATARHAARLHPRRTTLAQLESLSGMPNPGYARCQTRRASSVKG